MGNDNFGMNCNNMNNMNNFNMSNDMNNFNMNNNMNNFNMNNNSNNFHFNNNLNNNMNNFNMNNNIRMNSVSQNMKMNKDFMPMNNFNHNFEMNNNTNNFIGMNNSNNIIGNNIRNPLDMINFNMNNNSDTINHNSFEINNCLDMNNSNNSEVINLEKIFHFCENKYDGSFRSIFILENIFNLNLEFILEEIMWKFQKLENAMKTLKESFNNNIDKNIDISNNKEMNKDLISYENNHNYFRNEIINKYLQIIIKLPNEEYHNKFGNNNYFLYLHRKLFSKFNNMILVISQNFDILFNDAKDINERLTKSLKYKTFLNDKDEEIKKKSSKIKNLKINDFIKLLNKNELKINYYEPEEIQNEYEKITDSIKNNYVDYYSTDKGKLENETAGKFLYLVGWISRKSLSLSNIIFSELFIEFKKYLDKNKDKLSYNDEEDRRQLSIWVKNCLDEKNYFDYFSFLHKNEIEKYINQKDEMTQTFLYKLFNDLISLYTKCLLCYPLIEVEFIDNNDNNCQFNHKKMIDIIYKIKENRFVNFCYLPSLISNGKPIKGGKYYVFTYIKDKTYKKKDNLYDNQIIKQNPILYSIYDKKADKKYENKA